MLHTVVPKYTLGSSIWLICWLAMLLLVQIGCDQHRNISATSAADSRSHLIADQDLPAYEAEIDHRTYTSELQQWTEDDALQERGFQLYRANCYSCHGFIDQPGSLPDAHKFWQDSFANGTDPVAMYQTITKGHGLMPPQMHLVPSEKYAVIGYVREELVKPFNPAQYFEIDAAYIRAVPSGTSMGPQAKPFQPWADMDYGDWLMKCYEFADADAEPKQISKGAAPLADEDYRSVNFAYKGIAMRLDRGEGGIAQGNRFAMFDHDMLRFVGAWSGAGFIDWEDILFDGQHNVYPRTQGKVMYHTKITPGWANPADGSFADPRMQGADGRPFGPLPRSWAHYKGFYRCDDRMVIAYTVGTTEVLESYALMADDSNTIVRTLTIGPVPVPLKVRLAYGHTTAVVQGQGVEIDEAQGYTIGKIAPGGRRTISFFLSKLDREDLQRKVDLLETSPDLQTSISALEVQERTTLSSPIIQGSSEEPYTVDVVSLPFDNPQRSRIRPTGIDFLNGGRDAVVCTIDGEVWLVEDVVQTSGTATWQRMATGLFQPLGIKVHEGRIFVSCRDQIAVLNDLNDDGIIDHYESFNSDHQVTEHFHEFAMGLQTDDAGNFYYAKSGRHARKSLVPQHGTLLKVSRDGQQTTILAHGFRAANGVCLNPDGSFYVTDQQGFWNPMNRINHVIPGGFYGNMWGYGAPQDSSDAAMEQPLCWVDMDYDRSPAELVWAHSDRWGPLSGSLLSLSYGYGKIYQVMPQALEHQDQGGIIELSIPALPTGIMRGRINPRDGQLYICGMAAWATSRTLQEGGLYRIRYTGADLHFPLRLRVLPQGIDIQFSTPLDEEYASNIDNFTISCWDIKRSSKYGSDRYNRKELAVQQVDVAEEGHAIFIHLPDIAPTRIMEIKYRLRSADQIPFAGAIQSTVHAVPLKENL